MLSALRRESRLNSGDKVFDGVPVGVGEADLLQAFLAAHDFAPPTVKAFSLDLKKFARWFTESNREPFTMKRVTTRDVSDFRDSLRRDRGQAVASVNRALVRQDIRSNAVFHLLLYCGCRVGDVVALELGDLMLTERSGTVVFRHGKGGKQRSVPLPLPARKALQEYLDIRPTVESHIVFIGERGPLTDRGIRSICDKYSATCGFKIHPHLLRHTMAHQFLENSGNDLVSLAQILGHENLNTTSRYTRRTADQLNAASEKLSY
jgi:site-specific recombinase XerD